MPREQELETNYTNSSNQFGIIGQNLICKERHTAEVSFIICKDLNKQNLEIYYMIYLGCNILG